MLNALEEELKKVSNVRKRNLNKFLVSLGYAVISVIIPIIIISVLYKLFEYFSNVVPILMPIYLQSTEFIDLVFSEYSLYVAYTILLSIILITISQYKKRSKEDSLDKINNVLNNKEIPIYEDIENNLNYFKVGEIIDEHIEYIPNERSYKYVTINGDDSKELNIVIIRFQFYLNNVMSTNHLENLSYNEYYKEYTVPRMFNWYLELSTKRNKLNNFYSLNGIERMLYSNKFKLDSEKEYPSILIIQNMVDIVLGNSAYTDQYILNSIYGENTTFEYSESEDELNSINFAYLISVLKNFN